MRIISLKCGGKLKERKALNAAFAHDLRTPLTVLKGYNEMLQASDNSQTRETAATMGKHISRMENYVSSMSNLRRMEDTQPDYKLIDLQPLVSSLYDSAKIVCTKNGKELILQNDIPILQLSLDSAFISQVCNNLISNAVRYARTLVTISFALHDNGLLLSVSDDGNGFDKDSLQKPQIRTSQGKATIPSISDLGYIFVSYFVNTITVI